MVIKRICVKNFKSFKELDVDLGKFNVLIGPNASGKSNFIQIFKFLRDLSMYGLDNAISMQGGIEYLRNMKIGPSENLSIRVVFDKKFNVPILSEKNQKFSMEVCEVIYDFVMEFKKRGLGFKSVNERLTLKCNFIEENTNKKLGEGKLICSLNKGKLRIKLETPSKLPLKKEDIVFPPSLKLLESKLPNNISILKVSFAILPLIPIIDDLQNAAIYDIDPKLSKKATQITGKFELEEDGSNLSIVLKNLIENKEKKRKLYNLISELLPFVDDLNVEKFEDKSLLFKLREKYFKEQYLPASLISDGTINITALIIAVYFEEKPLTIIEEPERNIHPYLISKVIEMMKDASRKKQIIVTTHNPEMVKYAGLDNILVVSRNKEGFSTISRPLDKKEIKVFLENEIGIEELYVKNILGGI
ncbi:AAA family ATPase [Methanotorris igneus]|uniref:SMC domain protein n=1 Tax=Methanotorris igneus (strain DSM 5666 / JCM 11834 / Kol 5) TaxID=880724 RepID=F6BAJ3_METIK|nr:AAA family ATPase [Methanotorris igneus]AEF97006.1 SMC domain protein [Methanotorris igneus Kol 5]